MSKKTYLGFKALYDKYLHKPFSEKAALSLIDTDNYMQPSTFLKYVKEFCELTVQVVDDTVNHSPQWFLGMCTEPSYSTLNPNCNTCHAYDRYHKCPVKRYGHKIKNWHTDGQGNVITERIDYYYTFKQNIFVEVQGYDKPVSLDGELPSTSPAPTPAQSSSSPTRGRKRKPLIIANAVNGHIKMTVQTEEDVKRAMRLLKCTRKALISRASKRSACVGSPYIVRYEDEYDEHEPFAVMRGSKRHSLVLLLSPTGDILRTFHRTKDICHALHIADAKLMSAIETKELFVYRPDDNPTTSAQGYLIEPEYVSQYSYEDGATNLITAGITNQPIESEVSTMGGKLRATDVDTKTAKRIFRQVNLAMRFAGLSKTDAVVALGGMSTSVFDQLTERYGEGGNVNANKNAKLTGENKRKWENFLDDHPEYMAPRTRICDVCHEELELVNFSRDMNGEWFKASTCNKCKNTPRKSNSTISEKESAPMAAKASKEASTEKWSANPDITAEKLLAIRDGDDVNSKANFVAAFFHISEQDLLDIREGKYDYLLVTPEAEPIDNPTDCMNAIMRAINRIERKQDLLYQQNRAIVDTWNDEALTAKCNEIDKQWIAINVDEQA